MKRIPLTRGMFALVDDADFERLNKHKWCAYKRPQTFYAGRSTLLPNGKWRMIYMHREILGLKFGDIRQGDHKNHNGLDNRRDKLRICTCSQNHQNGNPYRGSSSAFKGISWHKGGHKWQAFIKTDGQNIYLGCFMSEIEAAKAYDIAAKKYFGEFALTNF